MRYSYSCLALRLVAVSFTLMLLWGCRDPNLVPVNGTIRRNGETITAGRVMLRPTGTGKPAFGNINSDGTFELMTERPGDGAFVGTYQVMVIGAIGNDEKEHPTNYRGPANQPVEIGADRENALAFDVGVNNGWQVVPDD